MTENMLNMIDVRTFGERVKEQTMIQKLFYAAAAAVTAFALVLLGGVLAQVNPASAGQGEAAVLAQAAQQSAAYQQQIQKANTQLEQAYQQQQALQQQLSQTEQQLTDAQQQLGQAQQQLAAAQPGNGQSATAFTPDQAAALALTLAPRSRLVQQPQLVNYQGTAAYEVVLNVGTLYLDASTGQVLAAVPASRRKQ